MNAMRWALGAAILSVSGFARAQAPEVNPQQAFLSGERRIAFEMRKKPWNEVFEWLVDQTGLSHISTQAAPSGSFNFISPKGATYTAAEVIDIINEGLLQDKYVLIRRPRSFTIISADQKVDPSNIARVAPDELPQRGASEMVQTVVSLRGLSAEEYAADAKRQLGPLGSVVPLPVANQLILQDAAGNLLRLLETIDGLEKAISAGAETFAYKCVYVKASTAEAILTDLLEPRGPVAPALGDKAGKSAAPRGAGMQSIKADDRTNTLFLNGRANKIAQAKTFLAAIDQPESKGQPPRLVGEPEFKPYDVPAGNAENLVKILSDAAAFRPTPFFRMYAVSPTRVLVYGGPEEQRQIAKEIGAQTPLALLTEPVPLFALEAPKVAASLTTMLGDPKNGAPYIEADADRNLVLVHGTKEQVRIVKDMIASMGENSKGGGAMRVFKLERGSAAALAAAIRQVITAKGLGIDVQVIVPAVDGPMLESLSRPAR
jgi:hypothetical protein